MARVPRLKLGSQGLEVSAQGLGCMGMSAFYGPPKPDPDMIYLIHHAVNAGVTFLDASDVYGPKTNEILLGKALKGGLREKVELATKFGIKYDGNVWEVCGDPAYVRAACEASLQRLEVDCIDLYYQHRIDTRLPIEITMGELKKLVEEGKIKYVGLSEALASTIRRAHVVHPITAIQLEWSLWTRDVEDDIIPTCRELGIGIVAYSPLGRGFFSSGPKMMEKLEEGDFRKALERGLREKVELATKFGIKYDGNVREVCGDLAYVRAACEASLQRLEVDCIDLYYQHRIDTRLPIEITMGELKKLVEEGKIKYVGLSEASASTIRRAHAVHPITAIQLEWSLWTRDVEDDIIPTCRLGIWIVAYSPLGRGFFSSGPKMMKLEEGDFRKYLPRFQPENLDRKKILFERVNEIAAKKGCTPSQLALAWVHHQGNDVVPIPGTKIQNLEPNIGALFVKLTPEEMAELESIASADSVKGSRYGAGISTYLDSETPPLSSWKA